jgi:hypothetical protein
MRSMPAVSFPRYALFVLAVLASCPMTVASVQAQEQARMVQDQARMANDAITVQVNYAKVVRLPEKTNTAIVGNPMVADVTILKNGNMVVTGKGFGVTNLMALDSAGNIIAESQIRVDLSNESMMVVQRGGERETHVCNPKCQPTLTLGDSKKFFEDGMVITERRNSGLAAK